MQRERMTKAQHVQFFRVQRSSGIVWQSNSSMTAWYPNSVLSQKMFSTVCNLV